MQGTINYTEQGLNAGITPNSTEGYNAGNNTLHRTRITCWDNTKQHRRI